MKNRKVIYSITTSIFIICIILAYKFKPITMNDIYDKPNFTGTVLEVYNNSILVLVNENEDEIRSSDKIDISLDTKLKDNTTSFKPSDKVTVYYDGNILESYPAQINTVYAITLDNE